MGALVGFFSDYQHNKWLDQLLSNVAYTPPTTLYLGLATTFASRLASTEVVTTQTLKSFTDFTIDGTVNTRLSTSSHQFTSPDQSVVVTGGTGWTPGTYTINSLTSSAANLSSSPAATGVSGGTGNIVRSTGYARVALTSGIFDLATVGRTQTNRLITLPAPTGDWGTIKSIVIYDALTGGNLLAAIATTTPFAVSAGDSVRTIAAGGLLVSRT